jgi:hypothetical protein
MMDTLISSTNHLGGPEFESRPVDHHLFPISCCGSVVLFKAIPKGYRMSEEHIVSAIISCGEIGCGHSFGQISSRNIFESKYSFELGE